MMTNVVRYKTNLNCGSCVAAVQPHLDADSSIRSWSVDTTDPNKVLTIEGDNVARTDVERHVAAAGFKVLGEIAATTPATNTPGTNTPAIETPATEPDQRSFWQTYKPLLLVIGYLLLIVGLVEIAAGSFDWMRAMSTFMGGFFLAFSFFKLLDLTGFANAFQSYDVLARPMRGYGYAYPFIELGLGIAYLLDIAPVATNVVTLVVMLVGIVGVSQALLQKRNIQCACLGTVFNLPMSKVTFIEDGLMAVMAATMLWGLLN